MIAPANTGSDNKSKTAVTKTDQTNRGVVVSDIPRVRMFKIVVMKFTAPRILLAPARCKEKIVRSTETLVCARVEDRGGYTVQPVPAPPPANEPKSSREREGGKSQNLILFIRGKAISGLPIIRGTNQFPNPPIKIGITIKKIIIKA